MKQLPEGTLVRVTDWALTDECKFQGENKSITAKHGYIWFVECYDADDEYHSCRSLATGENGVAFYDGELEVADG